MYLYGQDCSCSFPPSHFADVRDPHIKGLLQPPAAAAPVAGACRGLEPPLCPTSHPSCPGQQARSAEVEPNPEEARASALRRGSLCRRSCYCASPCCWSCKPSSFADKKSNPHWPPLPCTHGRLRRPLLR
jgi:hypothetical protein